MQVITRTARARLCSIAARAARVLHRRDTARRATTATTAGRLFVRLGRGLGRGLGGALRAPLGLARTVGAAELDLVAVIRFVERVRGVHVVVALGELCELHVEPLEHCELLGAEVLDVDQTV